MRMKIGNFSAWITIDGEEQPVHSIEYSPDGTVATCWIASEAGKNFVAFWQDSVCAYSTAGYVFVDGQTGNGVVLDRSSHVGDGTCSRDGFLTSGTTKRLFLFSNLELTDDDDYFQQAVSPELGEIKVVIQRCEILGKCLTPTYLQNYSEPDKVHERAKKAMGHRCKLGPEVACPNLDMLSARKIEVRATFIFKYRPLAQLQANGIVPQDKKRKRAATPDDVIDLCKDEPPATKRKPKNGTNVKKEPGTSRVKTEKPDKIRPLQQLEDVIDLT